jgi:hypothetical protein
MYARWFSAALICLTLSGCIEKNHCAEATNSKAAYNFAQEEITESLRSPSSAVFPKMSDERVVVYQDDFTPNAEECSFVIVGYVDAQNAFGAVMRSDFRVEAGYRHSNKTWFLTSLEFY